MKSYDYIIIGGGCSGLSLAMEIAAARLDVSVAIIESRSHYTDDKTWCFWDTESHPHHDLISRRWDKWVVANSAGELVCESPRYSYCRIKSIDFYNKAIRSLRRQPTFDLLFGQRVVSVEQRSPISCVVQTDQDQYSAPVVFDSRPVSVPADHRRQHFLGWTVQFERPVFAADRVTLMDFRWKRGNDVQFYYILPETATTALVETTYIGTANFPRTIYEADLKRFLGSHRASYTVLREECGAIPLINVAPSPHSSIVPIGGRAGCIRAATGYAFVSIQREAAQLVEMLKSNRLHAREAIRPAWLNWMDRAFLHALERSPAHASEMFYKLFGETKSESLVRFLNDCPRWTDALRVIWATPKVHMLRAAMPCV